MNEPIECRISSSYHYDFVTRDINELLKLHKGWKIHGELQITSTVNGPLYSVLLERFNDPHAEYDNLPFS